LTLLMSMQVWRSSRQAGVPRLLNLWNIWCKSAVAVCDSKSCLWVGSEYYGHGSWGIVILPVKTCNQSTSHNCYEWIDIWCTGSTVFGESKR
jgi:hypothetical protein